MKKFLAAIGRSLSWNTHDKIRWLERKTIQEWERSGRPVPPPHVVKQRNLRTIAHQFGLKTLVETGTYYGDMIDALKRDFDKIFSIELGEDLHRQAVVRFAGQGNVELIQGDSGRMLRDLLPRINGPSLFWLDGHYSAGVTARGEKDTPIIEELSHILDSPEMGHVIVVDDARCFGVDPGYPTIEEMSKYIKERRPNIHIEIVDDAIRITPRIAPKTEARSEPTAPIWTKQEGSLPEQTSNSRSNNQTYPDACIQAANDYRAFNNFRRNPAYNEILEHVTQEQGAEYLRLLSREPSILAAMGRFKRNDVYGNPLTFEYPGHGKISPTTLRYVKVLADLKSLFATLEGLDICEIGVGYGGQCRVIDEYFKPRTYCLVDMRPALALAQRFLDNYVLQSLISYKTANELQPREYDLVISNYAFTELSRPLQDVYLRKAILNSRQGYITYNEGSPPEFRSYKADELVAMIPGARILPEQPLTHPKNCLIVWGDCAAAR